MTTENSIPKSDRSEKFTPGPWHAGRNPAFTTVLDGHEGKAIYVGNHHIAWANAFDEENVLRIDNAVANAALIAAAPEMYNALKMACEDCEKLSNWEDMFNIGRPEGSIMPKCPCDGCYVKEALMKVNSEVFQEIKKAKRIFSYSQEMYDMLSELVETVRAYGLEKKAAEIEKLLKKARGEE